MRTFYAACLAFSITHTTFAATTIEFEGQGEEPSTFLISKGKVLICTGETEDMLYDERAGRVTMIDHAERGYFVMDPDEMAERMQGMQARSQQQMQQLQQQMGSAMEQMRQQMETLLNDPDIPDQQKRMIQQQMAQMSGGAGAMPGAPPGGMPDQQPMQVEATGESRKVAGIKCNVHKVSQGGRYIQEVCVAGRKATGVPQSDYQTMQNMFAFMRNLAEKSMAAMGVSGGGGHAYPDIEGVPVEIRDFEEGTVSVLRSVSTESIADSTFAIPAGYKELDPFQ